jgi:hypothetical protein
MGTDAECHVLTLQGGDLAIAQTRLNCDQKKCSIPTADPCVRIGSGHKGGRLVLGEELDGALLIAFCGNREDTLTVKPECRLAESDEPKEGVQSRQTGVAGPYRIASINLKVPKEGLQEGRIEIFYQQFRGRSPQTLRRKTEQQSECVTITRHRM